jgi:SEC-C motif
MKSRYRRPSNKNRNRVNPDRSATFGLTPGAAPITLGFVRRAESCEKTNTGSLIAFEVTSKRRRGFPSESEVKRGDRLVHGDKELIEKLGRNDLCPCGSGRRFQAMLS